mgnify:CR=1 FL=1
MEFFIIAAAAFAGDVYATKKYQEKKYAAHIGKQIVNDVLNLSLAGDYALPSNLTLPIIDQHGNAGTSQVDHVVISKRGIFVIETKHYTGSIVGLENSPSWHQYTKFDKHTFQNPLRQNYSHLLAIESVTPSPLQPCTTWWFLLETQYSRANSMRT